MPFLACARQTSCLKHSNPECCCAFFAFSCGLSASTRTPGSLWSVVDAVAIACAMSEQQVPLTLNPSPQQEIRSIWLSLEATLQIPKARKTLFEDHTFHCMAYGRCCLLMWTYAIRAAIAGVLLVAGIQWLAQTTSIQELMLNAVALNAILDVDEFLFACLTPIKIQHVIQCLQPLKVKYSRRRSQCETVAHFTLVLAAVMLAYCMLLTPLTKTMLSVKNELCGGNQSFVVSYNRDTQVTHGFVTAKATARDNGQLSISELAVKKHIGFSPETTPGRVPDYIVFAGSRRAFETDRTISMSDEAAKHPYCIETMVLKKDGLLNGDPAVQGLVEVMLRNAGLSFGREMVSSCSELSDLCDRPNADLLRLVCGETCGCVDPFASPWYKVPAQGCSTACLLEANEKLANASCDDNETGRHWDTFWNSYGEALTGYYGDEVVQTPLWDTVNGTVHSMLNAGCANLLVEAQDPVTGVYWCEGMPDLFKPLASICPQTCGCTEAAGQLPSYCPPSCTGSES